MADLYEYNKTMQLLGKQYYNRMISDADLKAVNEIVDANLHAANVDTHSMLMDIFAYGYIQGKRAARREQEIKL